MQQNLTVLESVRRVDLLLVAGVQGSGKTTVTLNQFRDRVRVNLDEIRRFYQRMTSGRDWSSDDWNPAIEPVFRKIEEDLLRYNLQAGHPLVVDNTSISRKSRAFYRTLTRELGKTIGIIFFDVPLETCLHRNQHRSARVPEPVLHEFWTNREMPAADEGFDVLHIVENAQPLLVNELAA